MKGVKMPNVGQVELPCTKKELIIVVGAEDHYGGASAVPHRLMFMAQAVRQAKMTHAKYDKVSVFWFQGKKIADGCSTSGDIDSNCYGQYTPRQIKAFETALKKYVSKDKLLIKEAKSFDDVSTQANKKTVVINGKTCNKKVRDMYFFGHGTPYDGFWLTQNDSGHYLGLKNNVYKIKSESFYKLSNKKAQVFFYSCQTGNSYVWKDEKTSYSNYIQKLKDKSSAQFVANKWRVTVKASMRRTNYSPTWKTGLSGRFDTLTGTRTHIDGKMWEDNGADAAVKSGDSSWQDDEGNDGIDTPSVEQGYFDYEPK